MSQPLYRWVQHFLPLFEDSARKHREPVGPHWRVDETYARMRGRWHSSYRGIDDRGQIVDTFVSATRDVAAARAFFERGIASTDRTPRRVITDKAAPPRPRSPPLHRARCIAPAATVPTGSSATTGS